MASEPPDRPRPWAPVVFALVFPTLVTWVYFDVLAGFSPIWQQGSYAVGKVIQFGFPAVWVFAIQRRRLVVAPARQGIIVGIAVGFTVMLLTIALYHLWLEPADFFKIPGEKIRSKVQGIGIQSRWAYVMLSIFYSIAHSGLEEYYWRWFVFGELRERISVTSAVIVSSLGFMAHHVLVLSNYFGLFSVATCLLSLAVAVGGAIWAVIYHRTGSLLGPWVSHAFVDAAIFWIGYNLVQEQFR